MNQILKQKQKKYKAESIIIFLLVQNRCTASLPGSASVSSTPFEHSPRRARVCSLYLFNLFLSIQLHLFVLRATGIVNAFYLFFVCSLGQFILSFVNGAPSLAKFTEVILTPPWKLMTIINSLIMSNDVTKCHQRFLKKRIMT